jgi:TP901 family phage tail tape measure protein
MEPAAVLAVVVKARGIVPTNTQLKSVHSNLVKAEAAGAAFGAGMQKNASRAASAGAAMQGAGRTINRNIGIPLAIIGGLSAKAAVDFEDSFADIRKTVQATEPQFAKLETGVRGLAKQIPISVHELNELGGQAGALGIKRKSLLGFIKTAAELGTTTDLSSDEAANALARISNIMGTSEKDFRRLGSTFVELGNKGASTEDEIAALSLRLAATGVQVGLSESQVLAFSSSLASIGVRAEAGGSAFSKVFAEMASEVATGGAHLEAYAKTAGMTSKEFAILFKKDAGIAMIEFLEGLDQIKKRGGNVFGVLKGLELKDVRVRQSLLGAAGAGKLFREQLKIGSAEWKQNNALTAEARKRYGTTASKIKIAKGEIYDFAITLGQNLLPVIADTLHILSGVASFFGALPTDVQVTILRIMALVIALGILLSLGGKLVLAYAGAVRGIQWLIAAFAASTVSAEVNAVANAELAASYGAVAAAAQTAAKAQEAAAVEAKTAQMSMLMPGPAKGGQMSLLATPASAAAATAPTVAPAATTAAARSTAMTFAAGLARMIPAALAIFGIASIVSSVLSGDNKGAMFKAGGAAAGAIAGGLAFGLPGALAGAGIGSIIGGFIGDLFDNSKDTTAFQEAMAASAGKVSHALHRQRDAAAALGTANQKLGRIGKRQKEVSHEVKQAEDRLAAARRGGKAGAPEVRKAEASLAIWKGRNLRLTKAQKQAEKLHGIALWGYKQAAKASVIAMRERGFLLQEEVSKSSRKLFRDKREHAGLQQIEKDFRRWNRATKDLRENQGRLGGKLAEVSRLVNDKYANKLKNANLTMLQTGRSISHMTGPLRKLAPSITPITALMKRFGERGKDATGKVKTGVNNVKGAMGPFQTETTRQLGKAGSSFKSWQVTSTGGIGSVEKKLGTFALQLGIKDATFGVTKPPKKQKGGMVVPGAGTGDKVPLTALVEPGEVVHVLNMRASKDKEKLGHLEAMNRAVPRFAAGGVMIDPAGPGTGVVNKAIAGVVGKWSTKYNAAINYGYDPGGGHVSPGHNITGTATDTGPAAGWDVGTSLFESGLRSLVGKVDQILYGSHGIGEAYPNHGWGNHAHIEWGMHPDVQGVLGSLIEKMKMTGPEGALKKTGQAVLDSAVAMANKKLQQLGGMGGGPDLNLQGVEGSVASQAAQIARATGSPHRSTLALFEALWAESGMGAAAPGNVLQGLGPGGAPIMPAAQEISGFLTGKPRWTGTAAIPLARSTSWPAHTIAQAVQKSAFSSGSNYLGQKQAALDTMSQFGLQKGGLLLMQAGGAASAKGKGSSIQKSVKDVLKGMAAGKHLPKYQAKLKKLRRRIDGIGISDRRAEALGATTKDIEKFTEYASNASAMTIQDEDGNVIQGLFKGQTEGAWLNQQLGSLLQMRKELIGVHGTISGKQLPRVDKLMKDARERLRHVRAAIREAERKKRELEKKVEEVEQAQKKSKQKLEAEIKDLENKVNKAQGAKKPNKTYIESLQNEIRTRRDAMSGGDKKTHDEVKQINEQIQDIAKANKGRKRVETALTGTIIPGFEAQHTGMHETMKSLFEDGGEIKGNVFTGLKTIQGAGGTLDEVPNPPAFGSLGGEIFNTQNRLREIQEEATKVKEGVGSDGESEAAEIANELAMEWKKRFLVSQAQMSVLTGFPSVQKVASMPFAGQFAGGGLVLAEVGERGREIAAMPSGSRIVPKGAADSAIRNAAAPMLNFEELNLYEDGSVDGKINGEDFDDKFKKVTRRVGSGPRTPGGRRR